MEVKEVLGRSWGAWTLRRTWRIITIRVVTSPDAVLGPFRMSRGWRSGRQDKKRKRSLLLRNSSSMSSRRRSCRRRYMPTISRLTRNTNCKCHLEHHLLPRVCKRRQSHSQGRRDCIKRNRMRECVSLPRKRCLLTLKSWSRRKKRKMVSYYLKRDKKRDDQSETLI